MPPHNWLRRYQNGKRDEVWLELRELGGQVHRPDVREEAQLVCDELARRARQNVEAIVERLKGEGFRFHSNDDAQTPIVPHCPPTAGASKHADWLLKQFGAVPMTLLAWARIVGDVWLVGAHPEWASSSAADPLVIELEGSLRPGASIEEYFSDEHAQWREWSAQKSDAGAFVLPLAPDHFHKDNVSGGSPYGMILPDSCADGIFVGEVEMPFRSYLNWVFRHGGFPRDTTELEGQWKVREALSKDLLPL